MRNGCWKAELAVRRVRTSDLGLQTSDLRRRTSDLRLLCSIAFVPNALGLKPAHFRALTARLNAVPFPVGAFAKLASFSDSVLSLLPSQSVGRIE